jgi:hypothetical protein
MISLPLTLYYSAYGFANLEAECPNSIPWLFQEPSIQELTAVVSLLCVLSFLSYMYICFFLGMLGEPLQLLHGRMLIHATLKASKFCEYE